VIRQGALGYSAGRRGDDLPLLFHCAEIGDVAVRTEDLSEDFLGRSTVVERERQPQVLVAIEHLQHRGTAALDFHAEAVRLDPGENAADHRRREGQPGEEKGDGARDQRFRPPPHGAIVADRSLPCGWFQERAAGHGRQLFGIKGW